MLRDEPHQHPSPTTDAALKTDVVHQLDGDPTVPSTNVGVSVTDHTVTLSGTVHSLAQRMAAVEATRRVDGVRVIIDDIAVHPVAGDGDTDSAIASRIRRTLEQSMSVPEGVTATVRDGIFTLGGTVDSGYQKQVVRQVIQEAEGAIWVENDLVARPRSTPEAVHSEIVTALHRSADLEARNINVVVEGSAVWLSGEVGSLNARQHAAHGAWSAPGVMIVHNDIVIR